MCGVFRFVTRDENEATSDFDLLASFSAGASPLLLFGLKGSSELLHVLQQAASKQRLVGFLLSAYRVFGLAIPVVGDSYFRFCSYLLPRFFYKRINKPARPFISYLHLWTTGSGQPKVKASGFSGFKRYNKLDKCISRLDIFLSDFLLTTMQDKFDELKLFSPSHGIEVAY